MKCTKTGIEGANLEEIIRKMQDEIIRLRLPKQSGGLVEGGKTDEFPTLLPPSNEQYLNKEQFTSLQKILGKTDEEIESIWKVFGTICRNET
jgi:hypothetical protein